jgi:hypothetical protein
MQLARECGWLHVFYIDSCRTHLRPTMKNVLLEMDNTNNNVVSEENKIRFFSTYLTKEVRHA